MLPNRHLDPLTRFCEQFRDLRQSLPVHRRDRAPIEMVREPFVSPNSCRYTIHHSSDQTGLQGFPSSQYCTPSAARFSTRAQRESARVRRRQPCFPSIARLKHLRSRKPIPPLFFGFVRLSHFIQCIRRLSAELPHQ